MQSLPDLPLLWNNQGIIILGPIVIKLNFPSRFSQRFQNWADTEKKKD